MKIRTFLHLRQSLAFIALAVLAIAAVPVLADDGQAPASVLVQTRPIEEVYAADAIIEAVQQATLAAQINGSVTAVTMY